MDIKDLQHILKQHGSRYPVFIDKGNEIEKMNNFPPESEYQCFMLNRDNKVLMVGTPSYNQGIWTLFKKVPYNKGIQTVNTLCPCFPPKKERRCRKIR
jgi:hypothetical protein